MPRREIRAVLAANDPLVARRLLELHRERLEECLQEQERLVVSIEHRLCGTGASRHGTPRGMGDHREQSSLIRAVIGREEPVHHP
jgi:hypothetical protein